MKNAEAQLPESRGSTSADPGSTGRGRRLFGAPAWLIYSLLTVLLYGIWGALSKVVSNDMSPSMYQVAFSVGLLPVVAVVLRSRRLSGGHARKRGMLCAFGTGVLGGTGNMALFKSLGMGGQAAIAVPVSSMYSVVTVVLAFLFLKEHVSRSQKIGLLFAFAAIYLLST